MFSVTMLSVAMLSVIMLSVIMLSVDMPSVIMQSVTMLSVFMLSVAMLSVIMLSVVMPPCLLGGGGVCISSRTHGFMSVATGNDHSLSKQKQKIQRQNYKKSVCRNSYQTDVFFSCFLSHRRLVL